MARSRLYRRQFLQVNTHFSAFFKIYKILQLNFDKFDMKKDLNDLMNAGLSLSAASKYLAKKNGLKKSEIYNLN